MYGVRARLLCSSGWVGDGQGEVVMCLCVVLRVFGVRSAAPVECLVIACVIARSEAVCVILLSGFLF